MENPGSLVILDDRLAREVARAFKVKVTGTAGLLIMAKERCLIKAVKPYLDKLIDIGFYLAPEHKASILKEANEA
jgi:predicted nucleic acid-binding protein